MQESLSPVGVFTRLNHTLARWVVSPVFLAGVLVVGVVARCRQYFANYSYWYDESFLLLVVRERRYAELLGPQPYDLVIPPIFLWLSRLLFDLFGEGELVQRLPAFVAGIATLFVMVPLANQVVGRVHAVWPVALLAFSNTAVQHGSEVRPYTFDVLVCQLLLWGTAVLLDPLATKRAKVWATVGLGVVAAGGVWLTFPSAFVLGGVSAAVFVKLLRGGTRREWLLWVGFNALVLASALLLWWVSARHMYYPGMIPHWQGWGGFPDWTSPAGTAKWVVSRPADVGNYGTREFGWVFTLLGLVGVVRVWKQSPALLVLLVTPFTLATAAALLGKYPLAHRPSLFLMPVVWLLACAGLAGMVEWGERRGWRPAAVGLLLIAWQAVWAGYRFVSPHHMPDYRGAYQSVFAERQPDDLVWSDTRVVFETYYGKEVEPLAHVEHFPTVLEQAKGQRLWVVAADNRPEFAAQMEAGGWSILRRQHFHGMDVLLGVPKDSH